MEHEPDDRPDDRRVDDEPDERPVADQPDQRPDERFDDDRPDQRPVDDEPDQRPDINDDTTTTGEDPFAACKELLGPGSCNDCICESCPTSFGNCLADEGCNAVLTCFETSGCTNDCYDVCGDVVDMYGGQNGPWYGYYENILICQIQSCQPYC